MKLTHESAKEGKKHKDIFRWKEQNETADKSDNTTWRDKPKDIGERRELQKILGQGQAMQTKQDIPK